MDVDVGLLVFCWLIKVIANQRNSIFFLLLILYCLKYCCQGVDLIKVRLFGISCNTPDLNCTQYMVSSLSIVMESVNHYLYMFDCSLFNSSLR